MSDQQSEKRNVSSIYTSKKEIPESPRSEAVINMPFLATNNMVFQQDEKVSGIVINPFTQNLILNVHWWKKSRKWKRSVKRGAQPKEDAAYTGTVSVV